jgi:hypothetical protein
MASSTLIEPVKSGAGSLIILSVISIPSSSVNNLSPPSAGVDLQESKRTINETIAIRDIPTL